MGGRLYNAAVEERFKRPATALGSTISGVAGSGPQGALIRFSADVDAGRLCNVGFRACACPHIIAACSLVAERLDGMAVGELANLEIVEMLQELEIPIEKTGKILILKDALRACHEDF